MSTQSHDWKLKQLSLLVNGETVSTLETSPLINRITTSPFVRRKQCRISLQATKSCISNRTIIIMFWVYPYKWLLVPLFRDWKVSTVNDTVQYSHHCISIYCYISRFKIQDSLESRGRVLKQVEVSNNNQRIDDVTADLRHICDHLADVYKMWLTT